MAIIFESIKRNFKFSKIKNTTKWISETISKKEYYVGDINIIFCSDDYLLKMNLEYLKHNFLTDIITFDYSEEEISGDLFISVDRVLDNSKKFSITFEHELNRVIIHGVLHLLGYKDKSKSEAKLMRKQENICLKMLKKLY